VVIHVYYSSWLFLFEFVNQNYCDLPQSAATAAAAATTTTITTITTTTF
jgi:hypothetical protein